jgi:hypothetical protein
VNRETALNSIPHRAATVWNFSPGVEAALAGMLYYAQW